MSLNYNNLNSEARLLPDSTWQKSLILHKSLSSKCLSLNQRVSGNPRQRKFLTNTEHLEINGAFHRKQRRTGLKRWIFAAWSFSYPTITATFPDATHKWSCRRKFQLDVKVCPEIPSLTLVTYTSPVEAFATGIKNLDLWKSCVATPARPISESALIGWY